MQDATPRVEDQERPITADDGTGTGTARATNDVEALSRQLHDAHEELARAHHRIAVLGEASRLLTSSLDYEATLRNVIDLVIPGLGDFGFFDLVEEDGQVRRMPKAIDAERQRLLEGSRWVRSERRDMNLCALSTGSVGIHVGIDRGWLERVAVSPEHLALMERLRFHSMITVPLRLEDEVIGALTLFYDRGGRRHTTTEVQLAEELGRRAALAVHSARQVRALRLERQRLDDAVRARDEFIAIAGHELRTPLASLELQIGALERGGPDPQAVAQRLPTVRRQVDRLTSLVDRLLDVSRMRGGELVLEPEDVDLAALVADVVSRHDADARHAGSTVTFVSAGPVVGRWDAGRLEQVATNLLKNALDYGAGGPVRVEVHGDERRARLVVADRGVGIDEADRARIFERFERASTARHASQRQAGLGLGLWIARQIVLAHGGRITVESAPGQGSTFLVELPRAASD